MLLTRYRLGSSAVVGATEVCAAYHRGTDLLVPLWTAPSSAPERRHEAGVAMQAAGPYALWVFVNPKAWAIGKAEVNDNRARWYGQHERSTAKLRWRSAETGTGGGIQRGAQPFDHLKRCIRYPIFKRHGPVS